MAKAPRPGTTPTASKADDAKRVALQIRFDSETYLLHIDDIGPEDDRIARREIGHPITPLIDEGYEFGADSILDLVWLARRKAGETNLRYGALVQQYPSIRAIAAAEPEISAIEEDDGEVDGGDPLPSDAA